MNGSYWAVSVGSTFCPECGADPVDSVASPRGYRFWRWLTHHERVGPTLSCRNGHSWRASSYAVSQLRPRSRINRALRVPIAVLGMLRRQRRLEPAPITYAVAAGVGTVVGVVADLLWGWSWWLVAAIIVVAVWLFFASTAFWGPFRVTMRDVTSVVNPHRARQQEMVHLEGEVGSGRASAYGVLEWPGSAMLGGWGVNRGQRHIKLRFLDPADDTVWVEVEATAGVPVELIGAQQELLAENLLAALADVPQFDDIHRLRAWHVARRRDDQERLRHLRWEAGTLTIDGAVADAQVARIDDGWVATAVLDEMTVLVSARRRDPERLELGRVISLRPFIEAMEAHRPE